jgi:hypothetical protein
MICRVWLPDNIRSGWRKIGLISDTDPSGIDIKRILQIVLGLEAKEKRERGQKRARAETIETRVVYCRFFTMLISKSHGQAIR